VPYDTIPRYLKALNLEIYTHIKTDNIQVICQYFLYSVIDTIEIDASIEIY
jgi:hypothetical protein